MICNVIDKCGGCKYRHDDYPSSLAKKQEFMESLFGTKVEEILRANNPYFYRNKVHDACQYAKGQIKMGKYIEGTKKVIEVDQCLIEDMTAQAINKNVRDLVESFKWSVYSEESGNGLFRGSLVRVGKRTSQYLLTIIVTDSQVPSSKNFVNAILEKNPEITSIVFNVNDSKTSMILGDTEFTAYGNGYIIDRLHGLDFRISSQSFYQVNTKMAENLYKTAVEYADLKGDKIVIDAYCGIGTISLYLSQFCKQVYGVESNSNAIRDAIYNSKLNKIKNVYFTDMDTGEYLEKFELEENPVDVIFVDPARSGLDEKAIEGLIKSNAKKIVYISCNPLELKSELRDLEKAYKLVKVKPVDMFPWTRDVEAVALFERK